MSSLLRRTEGRRYILMVAMLLGFSGLARSQESVSNRSSPPGGDAQPSPAAEELLERLRKMEEVNQTRLSDFYRSR